MENNELNLIPDVEIEQPKYYYDTVSEATINVPVYDKNGKETGTETRVIGRIVRKVWTDAEALKDMLRAKRKNILKAFDTYKGNVKYGIEYETEQQHENIIAWYNDLKDLKDSAFENIPERIKYYL